VNLSDYDYNLPVELIAQEPTEERDQSRLMVVNLSSDTISHRIFNDLPDLIGENDLIIVNDTKVFPARLVGKKEISGGEVELLLLRPNHDELWEALAQRSRRLHIGTRIVFGDGLLHAEIADLGENGHVYVRLESQGNINEIIDTVGRVPLPPYIKREPVADDSERYQTIYANLRGAVAAPTAGLHFTKALLDNIASNGVMFAAITLHVGVGTFRPLTEDDTQCNKLHSEYFHVPERTVHMVAECRKRRGKIIAVGTTTARALETASQSGQLLPCEGWTDIFIKPPYRFKSFDALITNFHLPRSSLILLVSAFAGREKILCAYQEAINQQYRFYSYGDAMLINGRER
jgi:S-adenosylmethionine:tRNA ribosyltransferase-isomerase